MPQKLIYGQGHRSFQEDWLPHRGISDIWQLSGIFQESKIPQAVYSFRFSLYRVAAGVESFDRVRILLDDLLHNRSYGDRWNLRSSKGEREELHIDENSILFGEHAQILLEGNVMALRLRGESFGLDLRLDCPEHEFWFGTDGRMPISTEGRQKVHQCTLPGISAVGHLYLQNNSVRVEGKAVFERFFGKQPLRQAKYHWERFYLFMDNGDEIALTTFPYGGFHTGMWFPQAQEATLLSEYALDAIDYTEVDEWRFASSWKLQIPSISPTQVFLLPLYEKQFHLPISHPVLGIYDQEGRQLGLGLAELLPGARNQLSRIGLSIFFDD